ncbi:MAG: hypothetical protein Q9222_007207 [Ikaeria aurantiellina]
MADLRSFHERTSAARPEMTMKPKTYLIAVLKTGVTPAEATTDDQYLWIKCHGRIKVDVVRQKYLEKNDTGDNIVLRHQATVLENDDITMSELDVYGDHLIVLEAITEQDLPFRKNFGREPLHAMSQITNAINTNLYSPINSSSRMPSVKREPGYDVNDENSPPVRVKEGTPSMLSTISSSSSSLPLAQQRFQGWNTERMPRKYDQQQQARYSTPTTSFSTPGRTSGSRSTRSPSPPIKGEPKQRTFQLQALLQDANPDVLEHGVEEGLRLLDRIKAPMADKLADNADAQQWIKQMGANLIKYRKIQGKHHADVYQKPYKNQLLRPGQLSESSAIRAQISYNNEDIPYRAQIEFIQPSDWEKELTILFQDLLDGNGNVSRECTNEDTDAGVAYAKIKAVYPKKTKDDLANSDIPSLLREVSHVLGKSREISESDSLLFYRKLQKFVDSQEKTPGNKDKDTERKPRPKEMEFWPLIKVVRLYVKAPALATGAVIVDLPGVHDSNAARAAVAQGYMKQTTGLWIVAPINRAVDDKAAKSLLGESFKRQLKLDVGFGSVTFICSKTDDISLTEAADSLGLEDEMTPLWEKLDGLVKTQKTLEKELEKIKDTRSMYTEVMNDTDDQLEIWEALSEEAEAGKDVFPPRVSGSKKRKSEEKLSSRKKQRRSSDSGAESDGDFIESDAPNDEEEEDQDQEDGAKGQPLTVEQITNKIAEFRSTKKEARRSKSGLEENIKSIRNQQAEVKTAKDETEAQITTACISGRNQYSKGAIQQDYAAGIRELDMELAAEKDEDNFDPDEEVRDYDEVARGLPVFCVSSRGYQKLKGRLQKDRPVPGFQSIEETEIPMLQAHCTKLTEAGRIVSSRKFLNNLSQLLNSLAFWASNDGSGMQMTKGQKEEEEQHLAKKIRKLESTLEEAVKGTAKDWHEEFSDSVYEKFGNGLVC